MSKITDAANFGEGRAQEIIINVKIVVPLWSVKMTDMAKEMAKSDVEQALTLAVERDGLIASYVVGDIEVK